MLPDMSHYLVQKVVRIQRTETEQKSLVQHCSHKSLSKVEIDTKFQQYPTYLFQRNKQLTSRDFSLSYSMFSLLKTFFPLICLLKMKLQMQSLCAPKTFCSMAGRMRSLMTKSSSLVIFSKLTCKIV